MTENKFIELNRNEMEEVNGGSLSVAAVCVIVVVGILVVSAAVSAYNGYQEEKRASRR